MSDPVKTNENTLKYFVHKKGIRTSICHVERRADEIWITNISNDEAAFDALPYETKRMGIQAFDVYGNLYRSGRPVFISRDEAVRLGRKVDDDERIALEEQLQHCLIEEKPIKQYSSPYHRHLITDKGV